MMSLYGILSLSKILMKLVFRKQIINNCLKITQ